jgi:hypothetical protein
VNERDSAGALTLATRKLFSIVAIAQNPPAKSAPPPRLVLSVTSTAWPDAARFRCEMRSAPRREYRKVE